MAYSHKTINSPSKLALQMSRRLVGPFRSMRSSAETPSCKSSLATDVEDEFSIENEDFDEKMSDNENDEEVAEKLRNIRSLLACVEFFIDKLTKEQLLRRKKEIEESLGFVPPCNVPRIAVVYQYFQRLQLWKSANLVQSDEQQPLPQGSFTEAQKRRIELVLRSRELESNIAYCRYEVEKNQSIADLYERKVQSLPDQYDPARFDQTSYLRIKQNKHLWLVIFWNTEVHKFSVEKANIEKEVQSWPFELRAETTAILDLLLPPVPCFVWCI